MYIAKNKTSGEILVMATDRGIPNPMLWAKDTGWKSDIPEPRNIMEYFTPVLNRIESEVYFDLAKKYCSDIELKDTTSEIYKFIKSYLFDLEGRFYLVLSKLCPFNEKNVEKILYRYREVLKRIEKDEIDKTIRRLFELLSLSSEPLFTGTDAQKYLRSIYGLLVWVSFCIKNDSINKTIGSTPLDYFRNEMSNQESDFSNRFMVYVNSSDETVLIMLGSFLSCYNSRIVSVEPAVGSTIFGTVKQISSVFGTLIVDASPLREVKIHKRKNLEVWSAADANGRTLEGDTVAVSIKGKGDNAGSRRREEFVTSIIDVFFPVMRNDADRYMSVHTGASNSYAVIVCRHIEKSRMLLGVSLKNQLEKLLGVARMIVCQSGVKSRTQIDNDIGMKESAIRSFVNDTFRALKVDVIRFDDNRVEVRIPEAILENIDARKIKTFISLANKVYSDFKFILFYGQYDTRHSLPDKYYLNSSELSFLDIESSGIQATAL